MNTHLTTVALTLALLILLVGCSSEATTTETATFENELSGTCPRGLVNDTEALCGSYVDNNDGICDRSQ